MDSLIKDIRYGVRSFLKRPGVTAIALIALTLGIGANTAIFSLVNAVVLQPLPYPDSDRLVWAWGTIRNRSSRASVSPPDYLDFRTHNKTFEHLGASTTLPGSANLTGIGDPERLTASRVTGNYFDVFGVAPALGRAFSLDNEKTGNDQVTLLSYELWQKRFGGDPQIVNKTIILESKPYQIIGVMPAHFKVPQTAELWLPINFDADPEMKMRQAHFLRPVGRLKAGVSALRIPLLRGRNFTEQEVRQSDKVVIVSQQLVATAFPNEDPLGKRLFSISDKPYEIIGVVGDIRHSSLAGQPFATMYLPTRNAGRMNLVVRTQGDPLSIVGAVRKEVHALDPDQPIAEVKRLSDWVDSSVAAPRYRTTLLALFAVLAMILAATGIYGVMSYSVVQRTHEIGVRMALGARRIDVLKMVVRQGMLLAVIGVALGFAGALVLTRVLSTLLFGVTAKDPITFGVVAALLIAVAFVACFVPARRATKVDPLVALRYE